jgi:hypothetical protein
MSRLIRKIMLIGAWAALTAGALIFVVGPNWLGGAGNPAGVRPVPSGDAEIAWMNPATNAVAWERFVAAIRRAEADKEFGLTIVDESNAFPDQTTAVPELAVTVRDQPGKLWFRWYKLTGDLGTTQWVEALAQRDPPPLAIIGGGSSDRARDLAHDLEQVRPKIAKPPVLLLTTATAESVEIDGEKRDLMQIYPGRTFRFCFTNKQMAEAVTDFIWSRDELRPDAEPVYYVRWADDPYSEDLFDRFRDTIASSPYREELDRTRTAQQAAWAARVIGGLAMPQLDILHAAWDEPVPAPPRWSAPILYSEGDFGQPSFWDAEAAEKLMDEYFQHPTQRRPLLVLPANPATGRRFIRALMRVAPTEAGRYVVATGDGIDFSTIYRDRRLSWPIQDLPVTLILFCHRNPVDPSAFQLEQTGGVRHRIPNPTGKTSTSTQDLLLYQDIVETLARAAYRDGPLDTDADALATTLCGATWGDGRPRFDAVGNQVGGSGEYVVWLEPVREGDRVRPDAVIQVWGRSTDPQGSRRWVLERRLNVPYFPSYVAPTR